MEHVSVEAVITARRRATYEDLCAVPERLVAEIVDGELITSPRPAPRHAVAHSAILAQLHAAFGGSPGESAPGGWWMPFEPELHLGDDVLVPDVAGWRRERMPSIPETTFFPLAPDGSCEVISPSSGRLDRGRKMPVYARAGVGHVWLVEASHAGEEPVRIVPFDAVGVDPRRWWADA
jgi:Uma2 family endonuclease